MQLENHVFKHDFLFEAGIQLPVTLGYECYGTLNHAKSNAILLCHYYTGTMHASGTYTDNPKEQAGWWDGLVGDGKAIDTQKFFVVCMNTPSNVQVGDPRTITTGAETLDASGTAYGERFPQVTLPDVARLQFALMQDLGIAQWHAVLGPSYGGMQALMWGVLFPQCVQRLGIVASAPEAGCSLKHFFYPTVQRVAQGEHGLIEALRLISFCGFGADGLQDTFHSANFEQYLQSRAEYAALSHILSIAHTVSSHNIWQYTTPEALAQSWQHLKVFSVNILNDQFFPSSLMRSFADTMQHLGVQHSHQEISSTLGHLACVAETQKFEAGIAQLLA